MIVTVLSHKGGCGKSTIAIHLAGYLQAKAPTILVDGDPNQTATHWANRGTLPFPVVTSARPSTHCVVDTAAHPRPAELRDLAVASDLFVIPVTPDALGIEGLLLTFDDVQRKSGMMRIRALLTMVPPSRDSDEARILIQERGIPLFRATIRRRVAFTKAALAGCLVKDVADRRADDAAADIASVGRELMTYAKNKV